MKLNKPAHTEIVKMQICDIEPTLDILIEAGLESWKFCDFVSEIERKDSQVFVGKIKTQVVGFCVARLIRSQSTNPDFIDSTLYCKAECEIYNIAVKREFQKREVGSRLLNRLISSLKQYNAESIWLEVRYSNQQAINFYQKQDFRRVYMRKNFYSNPVEDAIVMKRNL